MADKFKDHAVFEQKPEYLPTSMAIKRFMYNREEGTFMGRNGESWMRIIIFYLVFYAALASMFAICLWAFMQTVDPRIPKWQLDRSIIGTNPGLGFRPMPDDANVESSLIWYKGTSRQDYQHWVDRLEEFLKVYRFPGMLPGRGQNLVKCDYGITTPKGKVCEVDVRSWDPCIEQNNYNYHKAGPCIFLKLNKIYGWKPEFYNNSGNLPYDMPDSLKTYVRNIELTKPHELNTIWVSCEGENPQDIESLGSVKYIPRQGFPGFYFPYENSEGYLSPLVAVVFERPEVGILINIQCKAWARNIVHSTYEKLGLVHIELMLD